MNKARLRLALLVLAAPLVLAAKPESEPEPEFAHTIKPTAPIGIEHAFDAEPAVGVPLTITVTVAAGEALTGGSLGIAVPDGVTLLAPVADVGLGTLAAGDTATIDITVLPLAAEDYRLGLTVGGSLRGTVQSRTVAVSIRLAPAAPEAAAKAADSTAEKSEPAVHSFRAIETVR